MRAIRVRAYGGPETLVPDDIEVGAPAPDEALVRVEFAGVNFIDVYHRTGAYGGELPFTPGMEGAGVVVAVGADAREIEVGQRVAWCMHRGAYAELVRVPAWKVVRLPDAVSTSTAAAALLQGLTAHYLSGSTFPIEPEHTVLVHAAAGGVGLLLVQMARQRGARVIATVSNAEKAALARTAGADETILYTQQDFLDEVQRLTAGAGVDVVYDSVGQDTFERGLKCLKTRGVMVLYGQSSGAVPPIDAQILNTRGSVFLTRPSLAHYSRTRDELLSRCRDLLGWIAAGTLQIRIDSRFPLEAAADAHRRLEGRASSGKILLET
jgi:NADPH2:quinone reductase